VRVSISNLPAGIRRVLIHHYRIDSDHSNSYTVWKAMGSPEKPTPEQQERLEATGQLELLDSPRWKTVEEGRVSLQFSLPRQAVSLVQVSW
jgi:xylan 1,4-beta-xylosidase